MKHIMENHGSTLKASRPALTPAAIALAFCLAVPGAFGAEKPKEEKAAYTVKKGKLDSKTELEGIVEAVQMNPISLDPEVFTDLTVVDAVPHGSQVNKGDVLLRLDREKIDEQIEELELGQPAAKLAIQVAKAELENLRETTPLKLQAAERAKKRADDDLSYFQTTDRTQREKSTKFSVKSAEERLAGAQEELDQLKKMYEADDLTEETEEIILKRQLFAVEAAQFSLESLRLSSKRALESTIPRDYENLQALQRDQSLALLLSRETLPKSLDQKELAYEKSMRDQTKADKKLADLKNDLKLFDIRAPISGLVYYGACEDGKWTTGMAVSKKLVPNGKVGVREVFMTVVDPEGLQLRVVVPEGKLGQVQPGMSGTASPVSSPDAKIKSSVKELGYVPLPGGGFPAVLTLERDKKVRLMPGMNCKVTLGDAAVEENLLIPKSALFGEGDDRFVYLAKEDGHEKRVVKAGASNDKQIVILEGLAAGDKILTQEPE